MTEIQARIKDILYCDKSKSLEQISKLVTRQLELIESMYTELDFTKIDSKKLEYIKKNTNSLLTSLVQKF
jgi:plasmid maintenance system killer protein